MTPIAGFFIAIIAGWIVAEPRRAAAAVVLPYLAVTAVQTWLLANNFGINPPSTVTPFSGAISYYVVQLIFFITTVAIAAELAVVRRHALAAKASPVNPPAGSWYRAAVAEALCTSGVVVLLVSWMTTSALVSQHATNGGPPAQGIAGIALSLVGFVVLGVAALRAHRKAARAAHAAPARAEMTAGQGGMAG
jgi:hypothetical protein